MQNFSGLSGLGDGRMLFLFVAFIIGLSGSVFGAVIYGKEPGRIIPVTWMGIVTILYGFGIAGHFALGIYAVIMPFTTAS